MTDLLTTTQENGAKAGVEDDRRYYSLSRIFDIMFDNHKVNILFQPAIMAYVEADKRIVLFLYEKKIKKRNPTAPYRQCISRKDLEHILDMVRPGGNPALRIEDFDEAVYSAEAAETTQGSRSPWRKQHRELEIQEKYEE